MVEDLKIKKRATARLIQCYQRIWVLLLRRDRVMEEGRRRHDRGHRIPDQTSWRDRNCNSTLDVGEVGRRVSL